MRDLKKEDITIIGILIQWSENLELDKLKSKKVFNTNEFELMCKKNDYLINSDENRLGYDKTKYQVMYFINSNKDIKAKSYIDRVDLGDGEKYMPNENSIKEMILNIENQNKQSKIRTDELEF